MSGTQPVGLYAMKVPPGDIMVPGCPEFAAMFRVSMAAIDPSAEPDIQDDDKKPPRATLKIIRIPSDMFADDSDEEDDEDMLDGMDDEDTSEEEDSKDEEVNGGPSSPKKTKKEKLLDAIKMEIAEDEDEDDSNDSDSEDADDEAAKALLKKIMKGKDKAVDGEESDSEESDDDISLEMDETVVCTLDPETHYQQPLDIVVGEDERIFFKVSGTHTVHLTGNYVIPMDDGRAQLYDEEEEDYDLDPDEDELDALEDEDEESDELDDLEDPRVTEVDSEDEPPKLLEQAKKGKNKRPAEDSSDEEEEAVALDDMMAKDIEKEAAAPATNGETKKLSKAEKKKLKKLKKNDGEAAAVEPKSSTLTLSSSESKKEAPNTNGTGSEKKVQFAKDLEQGPTPSAAAPIKPTESKESKKSTSLGVRDVQGVTVDDRKLGSGRSAKKNDRVEMRYIGKLESGKQFDANKTGKPFGFKLGAGEVIKGWDIGLAGIMVGGERRLTIPAHLGYGKKGAPPDIPGNAKLIFDVKCLNIK